MLAGILMPKVGERGLLMERIRVLSPEEQVRMSVSDAGVLYKGYFILFTNSEKVLVDGIYRSFGIPRVISKTEHEFFTSGLFGGYRDTSLYGITYACSAYVDPECFPPRLAF